MPDACPAQSDMSGFATNQEFTRWNFPEAISGEPGGTDPVMAALVSHVNKWFAVTSVSQYC